MIIINNNNYCTNIIKFGTFPNGESNLNFNNLEIGATSQIIFKFENDKDLFNLYILKQYIDEVIPHNQIILHILYMPYSRMDRRNMFYTFNLKYVAKFINDLKFKYVKVFDAHSDVTLALLDRCEGKSVTTTLFKLFRKDVQNFINDYVVMFPDAGAEKRYSKDFNYPTVIGSKERNFGTGEIIKFNITGADVKNKNVVIIDDLCSKGGTFIGASKALKEKGALNVSLIVTHCENTIFDGELFKHIHKVYTTNSILDEELVKTKDVNNQLNIYKMYPTE